MYPINFDFGQHWDTKIKPLLDDPRVKRAITKGVNGYLNNWDNNTKKYKNNTAPAGYSSKDGYWMLMDRQRDLKMEQLHREDKLPQEYLDLEYEWEEDDDDDDTIFFELMDMKQEILKPYFSWKEIKYKLETYYLSGSCHWYAPTFELTLAKLIEPQEKWRVRVGDNHTTVINANKTKVFDLLYWANFHRLNNYVFGDSIPDDKIDPTLGGKDAYEDSK